MKGNKPNTAFSAITTCIVAIDYCLRENSRLFLICYLCVCIINICTFCGLQVVDSLSVVLYKLTSLLK